VDGSVSRAASLPHVVVAGWIESIREANSFTAVQGLKALRLAGRVPGTLSVLFASPL
jgi:hypothetical protein